MKSKPRSIPMKDYLVPLVSKELDIPEEIVDQVISWSFQDTNLHLKSSTNSIEISGFGKFVSSYRKIKGRFEKALRRKEYLLSNEPNNLKGLQKAQKLIDFYQEIYDTTKTNI